MTEDVKTVQNLLQVTESDLTDFTTDVRRMRGGQTTFFLTEGCRILLKVLRLMITELGYQVVSEDNYTDKDGNEGIIVRTTYPYNRFGTLL